ncbi:MAG: LysM peptidoglycan-binding domain-containing protein [Clostridiales Family XIII bacterium]|jgi:hypothetical protein|nr:LysM peptidoglycan-binding domain-containing protein [Clostridiales Family XIII bacterium]
MMQSRPHKTYRIASKFRFSVFIILIISALIVGIYFINAGGVFGGEQPRYELVDIQPGDTVWSIAAEHATDGDDIRTLVREIRTANDLGSEVTIYAGGVLKVPVG